MHQYSPAQLETRMTLQDESIAYHRIKERPGSREPGRFLAIMAFANTSSRFVIASLAQRGEAIQSGV
ncbi:hypothetical protein NVSP9465_01394 [Novosphingobium sp. CECT 9465]|nr:hypothetical protein NVSP9465_01394 [Novosphingobium sp. CECT 9465]